jgi:hypothetical protein
MAVTMMRELAAGYLGPRAQRKGITFPQLPASLLLEWQ